MALHERDYEVGVRDLHDRLSEHLDRVELGAEVVVTRRGRPIARLSAIDGARPARRSRSTRARYATGAATECETPTGEAEGLRVRARRRAAPLNLYWDTAALFKLVVLEDGSELAVDVVGDGPLRVIEHPLLPGGPCGARGRPSRRRLTSDEYRTATGDFEASLGELHLLGVDLALARQAAKRSQRISG